MTESIASDQRSKSVLLVPGPLFGNVFKMSAAENEGAPCQIKRANSIQVLLQLFLFGGFDQ